MSAEQNEPRVDDWVTLLAEELEDRSGMMAEDIEHQIRAFAPGPVAAPVPSPERSKAAPTQGGEGRDVRVRGLRCPACRGETLTVYDGGALTCSLVGCPDPLAVRNVIEAPASASVSDDEPHAHDWVRAGNESLHWGQVCAVDGCEARRYAAADALADLRQWGQHAEFIRRDHLMAKLDDLDRTAAAAPSRVDDGEPWVRKAAEAIVEAEIDAEGAHVLRAEELERIIAEHAPLAPSAGDVERNVEAAARCCRLAGLRVTPGSRPLPSGVDVGDAEREAGERERLLENALAHACVRLRQVRRSDKTPDYHYPGDGPHTANRLGEEAPEGERWSTPHELATVALHGIHAVVPWWSAPAPSDVQEDENHG